MNKLLTAFLIIFAMSTLNLASAHAGGHTGGSKCSSQEKKCKIEKLKKKMSLYWAYKDELKLSEDQLQKIADIKHAAMKQMILESAEVKAVKVDVKTEMWKPQIDVNKVNSLIDAKYAAKAKLAKTMVKALADAQAALTSDQRAKMIEIKTERYIHDSGVLSSKCSGKYCPLAAKHSG